jgi:hypothetical protein
MRENWRVFRACDDAVSRALSAGNHAAGFASYFRRTACDNSAPAARKDPLSADREETMARMIWALALCGMAAAALPAAAQGIYQLPPAQSAPEAAPFVAPVPPAPYDAQAPSPPKEIPQAGSEAVTGSVPAEAAPAPLASPVAPAPQNVPAAQAPSPKEKPQLEGKASEDLPAESAPQNGAAAEGKPADNAEGRFTFSRMNEGYVRLDNRTGQVSFCSKRAVGWTCQLAPEDRGVLENEITRLQEENASLKKELLAHGMPLPGSMKGDPPPAPRNERSFSLPSDPNIDRMKVIVEKAWRRLVDMINALQKDVLKKS